MRVVQRGNGAGLPLEPLLQRGVSGNMLRQHFDGDGALQAGVAGFVDLAHAPGAQEGFDLIRTERGAGGERH